MAEKTPGNGNQSRKIISLDQTRITHADRLRSKQRQVPHRDEPVVTTTISTVPIPNTYKEFLPQREFMNSQDLNFINILFHRFGLNSGVDGQQNTADITNQTTANETVTQEITQDALREKTEFGFNEYLAAATALRDYSEGVRLRFSPNVYLRIEQAIEETDSDVRRSVFENFDKTNPIGQRIHDMVSIFHHHPRVRAVYLNIHANKIEESYSGYVNDSEQTEDLDYHTYFMQAQRKLAASSRSVVADYPQEQVDTIGYLMGYDEEGCYKSTSERREIFATRGIGTFFTILRRIYEDAKLQGKDLTDALRNEFLARDGVAFMLMRTLRHDLVVKGKKIVEEHDMDHSRTAIQNAEFTSGSCPAILKMPSVVFEGTRRPIAYEIAHATITNMPLSLQ